MKKNSRILSFLLVLTILAATVALPVFADDAVALEGNGQQNDPYLIQSVEDLIIFRDLVNDGNDFSGKYILQTADLDLSLSEKTQIWDPIGSWSDDYFFYGVYNGGGHVIRNLRTEASVSGFFSCIAGTVMNLGIESGSVNGDYVGAIASHAYGPASQIINCYSFADVTGIRAGGIADNFTAGTIVDCWSAGKISGSEATGGIVSYNVAKAINCVSVGEPSPLPEDCYGMFYDVERLDASEIDINSLKETFKNNVEINVEPLHQLMRGVDGNGTEKDPYRIESADQLSRFRSLVNIGYGFGGQWFRQEADIDLGEFENWVPIGNIYTNFSGIYDGGGHKISNLNIKGEQDETVGFFGFVSGVVMNLGIAGGYVEGDRAAGLIGSSGGSIPVVINCYNNADVKGVYSAGGISASFEIGIIVNCLNTGSVSSEGISGGICATGVKRMLNCFSVGSPVSDENTTGVILSSCRQLDSAKEAVPLLNDYLYDAASLTNYQHNNLVKWTDDGALSGEYHNYFARFLLQEILIAILLFAILFLCVVLYKTSRRNSEIRLSGIKETVVLSKRSWFGGIDNRIKYVVCLGFVFGFGMLVVGLLNRDGNITKAFSWPDQSDAFMDFFNPMYTAVNDNCADNGYYTVLGETYPPIARAMLWVLGKCLPFESQFLSAKGIRSTTVGLLLAVFVFLICCIILMKTYASLCQKSKFFLPLCAILSAPMIFLFDRGNILIFVLVFSALFVAGYRSEQPFVRHMSYVCLALAASIKIYPVVLGLLVLREKKWKHTVQCIVYGVIFCVLPFFIIGIDELGLYIRNITASFDRNMVGISEWLMDYTHILTNLFNRIFGNPQLGESIANYTIYPFTLLLVACALLSRERWKAVLAVMLIQILYPGFTVYYCLALLAIPMLMFVKERHTQKIDYAYAVLFVISLVPLQFLSGALGMTRDDLWVLAGTAGFLLAIVLIVDCAVDTVKRIRAWKKSKNTEEQTAGAVA